MTPLRCITLLAAAAIGFSANTAKSDQVSGPIELISSDGAITVAGEVFLLSEDTRGSQLETLQEGDQVKVIYFPILVDDAFEALFIKRTDEGMVQ
jgi:hypothetical protein